LSVALPGLPLSIGYCAFASTEAANPVPRMSGTGPGPTKLDSALSGELEVEMDHCGILDRIFSSNAFIADQAICSTRRGLAPLLAALPLSLSQTDALADKINPSETQVTPPDAIKWRGWIKDFPPHSGETSPA
jgi:hypothetical protein